MVHRDPLLAIREKLDARERDLEEVEADLEEAHQEIARHRVRVEELESQRQRVATPAARAPSVRPAAIVIALVSVAAFCVCGVIALGAVAYLAMRPSPQPVISPPPAAAAPVVMPALPTPPVVGTGDSPGSTTGAEEDEQRPTEVLDPWR